jgi:hypothetical protein
MAVGLYDLTREYLAATPERKEAIEAERASRFADVKGWPSKPSMIYQEVAQNVWDWDDPRFGIRYYDNNGRIVGGPGR